MKRVVIYARVSTLNQDFNRQINDLTDFAKRNDMIVDCVFAEKVSGTKRQEERPELLRMIDYVNSNKIEKVLVSEVSRLHRTQLGLLETISLLNENKISVYIQNLNIETLTEDKKVNPMAQLLVSLLSEIANLEKGNIRERMQSGYKAHLAKGLSVGRKIGYRKDNEAMKEEYTEDIKLLRKGYSLRNIQKITGTSVNTLRKVKAIM
ncbi:recombinase family protein [Dysgonomonas sp. BGC7]|uniref:recombinase family protein n=1 Tax=Dysgonomonas sp. BGC7 TaxID=1658008 RepID=UPI0006805900|nr:recombinase family protein [Dysgonomonas sp. BGC7]MBD8387918.1 recombinase family protein [Dysgonomonas sp. BGC7]